MIPLYTSQHQITKGFEKTPPFRPGTLLEIVPSQDSSDRFALSLDDHKTGEILLVVDWEIVIHHFKEEKQSTFWLMKYIKNDKTYHTTNSYEWFLRNFREVKSAVIPNSISI